MIGLKVSRQLFNQREAWPRQIAPCTRDFPRASNTLEEIAGNDYFIAFFAPFVILHSNYFCIYLVFSQSFENLP